MRQPFHNLTIKRFHEGLLNKEFSALEVAQDFFKRIKETDGAIGAYLSTSEDKALRQAEQVDIMVAEDKEIPMLAGVPLAVKDVILIKGESATAASKILERYIASYNATVINKLKAQEVVFLGKTNLDEFAMGASTENSAFHVTKNPHDHSRVPGGSSGGSAAAVAAHLALAALGSDTGGSIRQPAAFCGIVGLKPTYGAVSRSGLIAMASSLDQIGPIAKTAEDTAMLFDAIRGRDPMDATSSDFEYGDALLSPKFENVKKLTVGLPKEYFIDGVSAEVRAGVELAIEKIKKMGLNFREISLPHTKYALSAYYIIVPAEISANLARFDGIRYAREVKGAGKSGDGNKRQSLEDIYFTQRGEKFGPEVKRRIILGTFVLSSGYYDAYYDKAQRVRALVKRDFDEAFKKVDVILTPVTPTTAFKIGEKVDDPLAMYLSDVFTVPVNLAGLPALAMPVKAVDNEPGTGDPSVPRVATSEPLPVGFQLIGKPFHEVDILGIGQYYEKTGG